MHGWVIIAAILGTLPIYDDLRIAFRYVLEKLHMGLLLRQTSEIVPLAWHAASANRYTIPTMTFGPTWKWRTLS
jgi:hypothetical protein